MDILYQDKRIIVCIKPSGVLSTDEPGGMPQLIRQTLGDPKACVRTVHRLDRVVSGVMVLARSTRAASELSAQIRAGQFGKEYLAVIHGKPENSSGTWTDLLLRDKTKRMTFVTQAPQKNAQEAILDYETLSSHHQLSLMRITLHTGRTHQIRVQFASRSFPLVGDKKYGLQEEAHPCPIALWSHQLSFRHPETNQPLTFCAPPPHLWPWTEFFNEQKL